MAAVPGFGLDGSRALVTGASRGIGRAAARALAAAGEHAVLAAREAVIARIPMGPSVTAEEVAQTIALLRPPAAGMVTVSAFLVDGGWTAQ